jgi:hypothetical protein
MVDVILSSDNVTVLGGPSKLEVDLNIGAPGSRGSLFLVGTEDPSVQNFTETPILFDIYINVNQGSENYLQAYQYVNRDGQDVWDPVFKIKQEVFSFNRVLEFGASGQATANIEIFDLGLDQIPFSPDAQNSFTFFNVSANITNLDLEDILETPLPVSFSYRVGNPVFDSAGQNEFGRFPFYLPVTFNAVEFDGTDWAPLVNKKTYCSITVSFIKDNELLQFISNNGGNS